MTVDDFIVHTYILDGDVLVEDTSYGELYIDELIDTGEGYELQVSYFGIT